MKLHQHPLPPLVLSSHVCHALLDGQWGGRGGASFSFSESSCFFKDPPSVLAYLPHATNGKKDVCHTSLKQKTKR